MAREALIGFAVVVWASLAAAPGCTSPDQRAPALRPISLPDLSQVAPSAQAQIRDRYVLVTEKTATPQQSAGDLANAYGELGKILMAADHRDAAEPCFLDAQALASGDFRWPYYLAHLYRQNGDLAKSIGDCGDEYR